MLKLDEVLMGLLRTDDCELSSILVLKGCMKFLLSPRGRFLVKSILIFLRISSYFWKDGVSFLEGLMLGLVMTSSASLSIRAI